MGWDRVEEQPLRIQRQVTCIVPWRPMNTMMLSSETFGYFLSQRCHRKRSNLIQKMVVSLVIAHILCSSKKVMWERLDG